MIQNNLKCITFYQPLANKLDENHLGSHAKFCICDSKKAYVGSANFSNLGLNQHFEMGVLLHGPLAKKMQIWKKLIEEESL